MNNYKILSRDVLAPFAAMYGVGLTPLLILPYLFSAFIATYAISEAQAGLLITYNLTATCLTSFAVASVVHKVPRQWFALLGMVLAIAGNIFVIMADDASAVVIPLVVSGIGCGITLAVGNAVVASYADPEKAFDKIVLAGTLLFILLLVTTPYFVGRYGLDGAMYVLIGMALLVSPGLAAIKDELAIATLAPPAGKAVSRGQLFLLKPISLAVMAMVLVYFIRDTMIWMYAERIGVNRIGFDPETLGVLFGVHGATSLLGPVLLILASRWFGRSTLLIFGILASGGITIAVSQVSEQWLYAMLVVTWSTFHFYTYSCLMGTASVVDKKGRVVAAAGGAVMAANAIAPAIAGYAVELGGYKGLGIGLTVFVALTLIFAIYVIRKSQVPEDSAGPAGAVAG